LANEWIEGIQLTNNGGRFLPACVCIPAAAKMQDLDKSDNVDVDAGRFSGNCNAIIVLVLVLALTGFISHLKLAALGMSMVRPKIKPLMLLK
jgi:hypothetical protein